ncbi:hypothetical protein H7F33_08925 [Pedobacter sp. PAMC26386]|nr:hypothetical protein H7F33_08925 [Pedobacter sp. PAMC26386]
MILLSCSGPKLGKEVLDLKTISMDFNAAGFFQKPIEKSKGDESESDKNKEEKFLNSYSISIDTLIKDTTEGNWIESRMVEGNSGLIASQYNMTYWHPGKYVAAYSELSFSKIGVMVTEDNELMGLVAVSDETDSLAFEKVIKGLTEKYGKPENQEKDFFGIHYNKTWKLDDRIIQLVSKTDDRKNTLSMEVGGDPMLKQKEEKPVFKTYLFIVPNTYQQSVRGKLSFGDWLFLM